MLSNRLLTAPAVEPVSLAEMKAFARIENTDEDDLLASLIKAARVWCENFSNSAFIAQGWRLSLARAPRGRTLVLPRAPLLSLDAAVTYDPDDTAVEWDLAQVIVDAGRRPGCLVLREDASWPTFRRPAAGMTIDYMAGYGASSADVPDGIKTAIKQLALHWYENREAAAPGLLRVPLTVEALLLEARVYPGGLFACV